MLKILPYVGIILLRSSLICIFTGFLSMPMSQIIGTHHVLVALNLTPILYMLLLPIFFYYRFTYFLFDMYLL